MSTRFLPMSCTSPRTVARTIFPLPASLDFSMCGSSSATAVFMTSADCSTNGSCISPEPNRSPTTFMPASRWSLMICRALSPPARARSRSASSPLDSPSMMRRSSRSFTGRAASSAARASLSAALSTPSNRSSIAASGSYVRLPSASYSRRSHTRSRATLRRSSGTEASGTIFAASMMPDVRPASAASCRNTELSTLRAAGFRPNDTLLTPSVVWIPGYFAEICRIASIVSIASRRVSS